MMEEMFFNENLFIYLIISCISKMIWTLVSVVKSLLRVSNYKY